MLRLLITLPFLAALIVFAIYNQEIVTLSVPGYSRQSSLAVLVMVVAVVFFLIGGLSVWFAELRQRRRARRAEQTVRTLETQVSELKLQLAQAVTENHMAQQGHQPGYPATTPSHALPPPSSAA
ncbi:lipopolysaccharide assembly protein LapA domain-containing protein [Lichenicoccus sp.]|uniref:lipopolysaccharide assembly protein LapA domain-containing protein n=1 Tax=Lichenicoccus sp. TaxID=2781899 RepID=UPI003D0E5AB3